MIHYALQCAGGHGFDGWFQSSTSFDHQAQAGHLECPTCGGHAIERALMAPRIGGKSTPPAEPSIPKPDTHTDTHIETAPPPRTAITGRMPDGVRAMFARLRQEIETRCDYVGPGFASEARRIHEGDAPARAIYGEASPEEAEALAEDGIEISSIPWVPRTDS